MNEATCSISECDRPAAARGWCAPHHKRWLRNGDPGSTPIKARRTGCQVDDCGRPHFAHGYCQKHAYRYRENGDPLVTRPPGGPLGEASHSWQGEDVGYSAVHRRLRVYRGPAKHLSCIGCGDSAASWAYQHTASDERICPKVGLPFTTDLTHYEPMCLPCHTRLDHLHGWTHPSGQTRGASYSKQAKRWRAYATLDGRQHSAGLYDTKDEAAAAAMQLRMRLLETTPA